MKEDKKSDNKIYGIGKKSLSNIPKKERIMAVVERVLKSIREN